MALRIAVVIATHNRDQYLMKALDGLSSQTLPAAEYEVLVIDNASTDATRERVLARAKVAINIQYIYEPTLGASAARNTGWRAARSPYVAFLDDDAIPDRDWLERIIRAFEEVTPHPACVGGRVEPIYEVPPPDWIEGLLLDYLTVIDHSPVPVFLVDIIQRQKLASANMAVERHALEQVGGLNTRLDRVGTRLLSGGDVLVQLQLEKLGMPVYYDPAIHVRHHVSAKRLTREWMADRAYWGGVSDALLSFFQRGGNLWWAARTLSWGVRSVAGSPRLAAPGLHKDNPVAECAAWHRLGFVVGGARAIRLSLLRD
jgi:glycosyltransferase involved in cell wall biosynthesis